MLANMAKHLVLTHDMSTGRFDRKTWVGIIDRNCNIIYSAFLQGEDSELHLPLIDVYKSGYAVIQEYIDKITDTNRNQESTTRRCKIIKLDAENSETVIEWLGNYDHYRSFNNDNLGQIGYANNPNAMFSSYMRAIIDMEKIQVISKKYDYIEQFDEIAIDGQIVYAALATTKLGNEKSEEAIYYIDETGKIVSALYYSLGNEYIDTSVPGFDLDAKIEELNNEVIDSENSRINMRYNLYKYVKVPKDEQK